MNDLEQLIAAVRRPDPTDRLDERLSRVLASESSLPAVRRRFWPLAVLASAIAAGLVGFYCGRLSAGRSTDFGVIPQRSLDMPLESSTVEVVNVPLEDDQVAGLFVRHTGSEGLLGKGPVKIEITTTPSSTEF